MKETKNLLIKNVYIYVLKKIDDLLSFGYQYDDIKNYIMNINLDYFSLKDEEIDYIKNKALNFLETIIFNKQTIKKQKKKKKKN